MTRVTFETATFADAIKKADRVAPAKGAAFDKASGIVIEVNPSLPLPVIVKATSLDVWSMEWVDVVEVEGNTTTWRINSKLFAGVMASLPIGSGKTVTLEEKLVGHSTQLHLTSGRTKARFYLMDATYYPEWGAFDPDDMTPANDLGGRLAQVEWATDKSAIPICGVHLTGDAVVATDRFRLAYAPLKINNLKEPITIPAGILAGILRQTGEISIGVSENMLLVMPDEHTQIKTVIYDSPFPKIEKAMIRDWPETIKVKKTAIYEIMQRATSFAGADRLPTLRVFIGKEEIAVMMNNEEVGILGDVVEVPGYAVHDRVEYKFTPKNLMEAINAAPNEEIEISYDPGNPKSFMYINGGSGYEAWSVPRADVESAPG